MKDDTISTPILRDLCGESFRNRRKLIQLFSETRDNSPTPNILIKVLRTANYNIQHLPLQDKILIFRMKQLAECLQDNKNIILDKLEDGSCN